MVADWGEGRVGFRGGVEPAWPAAKKVLPLAVQPITSVSSKDGICLHPPSGRRNAAPLCPPTKSRPPSSPTAWRSGPMTAPIVPRWPASRGIGSDRDQCDRDGERGDHNALSARREAEDSTLCRDAHASMAAQKSPWLRSPCCSRGPS